MCVLAPYLTSRASNSVLDVSQNLTDSASFSKRFSWHGNRNTKDAGKSQQPREDHDGDQWVFCSKLGNACHH